jgi:hypothetical protein
MSTALRDGRRRGGWTVIHLPACACAVAVVLLGLVGCSVGPRSIPADRFNYSEAIARSYKEQMLLNVVRLRYGEMPVFVEVSNIVSGYTMASKVNAGAKPDSFPASLDLEGEVRFEERPTLSYKVLTGGNYTASLLLPLELATIWYLVESGWDAELILRGTTTSIGGITNRDPSSLNPRAADPRFEELLDAIGILQSDRVLGLRTDVDEDGTPHSYMYFRPMVITTENEHAVSTLRALLNLPADMDEFVLQYETSTTPGTISVRTRSLLQILIDVARDIEVPAQDLARGSVAPGSEQPGSSIRIRSGTRRPAHSYCAVKYRENWFWIDTNDYRSKSSFSFLMIMFQLRAGESSGRGPILTIPT